MCSYGGRIVPCPTNKSLSYLSGETRMVVIDCHYSLMDLSTELSRNLLGGCPFSLKYQFPNKDLDSLISVATDEELDRISAATATVASGGGGGGCGGSTRSSRLRLFLFPSKSQSTPSSIESLLVESKLETWFVDTLNSVIGGMGMDGLPSGLSIDSTTVNCLLGLEDDSSVHSCQGGDDGGAAASATHHPELE